MAAMITNGKILFLEIFFIALVSSAPHGLNDQSGISTTTSALKTALTTVFALGTIVSLAIVFFGCICCQQQRFKSGNHQSNGIPLPQHSNNADGVMESEFAIFPPPHAVLKQPVNLNHDDAVTFEPLPDIRLRKFSSPVAGYFPKPAYFSSDVNKGLSLHDWFDDPHSNFPRSQLQYFSEVGSGWFGQVVEGEAQQIIPEDKKTQVVVKILREDASPSEHIYFLHEVRLFRDLKHPNVLRLLGRCLEVDPFLVILEHSLMDLKSYLIQHRSNPESLLQGGQLLRAACHVAKGLTHMHENNILHTDLAARNCLVSHDHLIKIGDYGISVNAFKEDYYCVGDIALPIRWCSPESLVYSDNAIRTKDLTQEANIWSFGVLLWEMIELGKLPYMEFSDEEVLQKAIVQQILTLEQPKTPCLHKDQLWQVMKLCWNLPRDRPSVHKISLLLDHLFENKDVASDSVAFETRWNALQPVVREHNLNPASYDLALTFESDFVPNQFLKVEKNQDNFLSSDFDVSSLRETSSSRCSLTQSFEANFGKTISPSLQNLRGSLEDLALHNSLDRELNWDPLNVTNNPTNYSNNNMKDSNDQIDDKVINDQICEAIKDLDEFLAGEVTSSEVSKDTTPERNESGDEDMEFKNDMSTSLVKSEPKNGSATTLTDVNTETGETLPKDSSDDSLHAHLIGDLSKLDGSSKTDLPDLVLTNLSSNILEDHLLTSAGKELTNSETKDLDFNDINEMEINLVSNSNQTKELDNKISHINSKISPKIKFPEKEPHRDSAIVLESESSSSTLSSKMDDVCSPQSPMNNIPSISNQSSHANLVTNEPSVKGESSTEEYVSTIASPQAFVSSFTSDSSTLLSILNEPLTCGNPGSTTSMAIGGNGGNLLLDSASKTNTLDTDQPSLLTKPTKSIPIEDSVLTKNGCDFRCTLNNDVIKPNLETSSTNYLSLSLDATHSQSDNVKDNTSSDVNSFNACEEETLEESNGNTFNSEINSEDEDIVEGCTDEMEVNFFSDSDLESLGEGYDGSESRTHKSSTPRKDRSKPSKSLSESSLGATYYTACDRSNLDESLKLEEESVLPFIEITLCEDTLYNTCHSDTPTINDEQNSESDMADESFEQQLGYLSQEYDVDQNFVEAINSELIYGFSESTPSENSPSMLSVPSSENLKLDKDCFSETLFMQTDEGNCRPNYKTQLASFAFEKELNGIVLNRELNSIPYEKPQVASQYSKINNDSVILSNVEKRHNDLAFDSFSLSSNKVNCQDSSYHNSELEQSNPEITSSSFLYINSKHASWFHPPPHYEDQSVNNSNYYDEESIVEDISEGGAQAPRYLKPNTQFNESCQEYQLEDILACLDDTGGGNDNPAYSEEDIETNPSIFSPIEDSGKYSSMADDDDNSIILDDVNQGAHCSDDMKDYLDDEVLIIDTETNEAVMLDSKERLSLAMGEENISYYDRQLYVNEVYDPDNYYGPTKLESIVEEFEGASNATSPSYSADSNLSNNVSPDKGFENGGMCMKINEYGFNSQENLDKSISDACSCVEEECSTNFGAKSSGSPEVELHPPVLIFEGEEYLAGAETDDGFDDYDNEDYETEDIQRPGTSMLDFKDYRESNSQTASETDEDDFISPKERREDVLYTPDFDSETDDTSSTGTSESSTSGSFECSNDDLDEKDENCISPVPEEEESKTNSDNIPASPVKIFSTAWDSTLTPTKSAIKSPEKKVGDMKKSVSFHEEGPAYIFSYPPESDSEDEDEGNEVATEFTWHVDYTNYADWEFQPIDDEEIPEDIVEIDDIEVPEPEPLAPVNLSTMIYSIIGISEDDLLDSLDSQTRADNGVSDSFVLNEFDIQKSLTADEEAVQLRYATEEETSVKFDEEENAWPIDDFPEIITSADDEGTVDDILETINPFIIDLSVDLPCIDETVGVSQVEVLENGAEWEITDISKTSDKKSNIESNMEKNSIWIDDNITKKSPVEFLDNSYNATHKEEAPDLILTLKSDSGIKQNYTCSSLEAPHPIEFTNSDVFEVIPNDGSMDLNQLITDKESYHEETKNTNNSTIQLSSELSNLAEIPECEIVTDSFSEFFEKRNLKETEAIDNYKDNGNLLPDICNIEKEFKILQTELINNNGKENFQEHREFENVIEGFTSHNQIIELSNCTDGSFNSEATVASHKVNSVEEFKVDEIAPKLDFIKDVYQSQCPMLDSTEQVTTTTTKAVSATQSSSLDPEHSLSQSTSDVISESEDEESLKEKLLSLSCRNDLDDDFPRDEIHAKFHDNIPGKYFGISPNKKYYNEMQLNYNLNDRKDPAQDIPLEIDEILFEMERSFSLTDIASSEPVALSDEYKLSRNDDKKRNLLKFKEDSLSFEGESSESKSSSSLPKLNDISPALSSDIDICESDLEDIKDDHKKSDKYVIKVGEFNNTDNVLDSTIVNGNFINNEKEILNYENNNEERVRLMNEVGCKTSITKMKTDNSTNQDNISS